jgi:hypothetical protein
MAGKLVFVSTEVPEECIQRAQVAIVTDNGWHLLAPIPYRCHGLDKFVPMPKVNCPIVDIRPVRMDDDDKMMAVMASCVDRSTGVINMSGLLSGLEALGAKVTKPVAHPQQDVTAEEVQMDLLKRKVKRVARRVHGERMMAN